MTEKNGILKTIGTYVLGTALTIGASQYANAQDYQNALNAPVKTKKVVREDVMVIPKKQYEDFTEREKATIHSLYYASKDSLKGSVPLYSISGFYDASNPLYLKHVYEAEVPDTSAVSKDSVAVKSAQKQKPKARKWINAKEDLNVADRSRFLVSTYSPIEISPNASYDLESKFESEGILNYRVMNPNDKEDVRIIGNDIRKASPQLRKQYAALLKEARKNGRWVVFDEVIKDGKIDPNESNLLMKGTYFVEVNNSSESGIRIFKVRKSNLEQKVIGKAETNFEEEKYTTKPESKTDITKADAAGVYETGKEKLFYIETKDSLYLTKPITELTKDQRNEWLTKIDSLLTLGKIEKVRKGIYAFVHEKEAADEEIDELRTRAGLQAFAGTNSEYGVGAFVESPIFPWLSWEGFANWYASHLRDDNGLPVFSDSRTDLKMKEVQQAGTKYKYRTDYLTTNTNDKAAADIGAGLTFKIPDWNVEFPLRAGVNLSNRRETLNQTSNIRFEENMQTLEEQSISNSKPGKKSLKAHPTMSAGARYNLTKNLSVGAEFNRTGKTNSGRLNVGVKF